MVGQHEERELRAARNQAMFRAVNEKLSQINEAFNAVAGVYAIACECADTNCIEMLELGEAEYEAVRGQPRHFVVLPGHVYLDVEDVIDEADGYVVVEKHVAAAEYVEATDPRADADGGPG